MRTHDNSKGWSSIINKLIPHHHNKHNLNHRECSFDHPNMVDYYLDNLQRSRRCS